MSGVDASDLRVTAVLKYTFHVWIGFRQVVCAIGGVTRGAWFASRFVGDDAAVEQALITISSRGRCIEIRIPCVVWVSAISMRNCRCDAWCQVCLKVHS